MENEFSTEIDEDMLFEMYNDVINSSDSLLAAKCPSNLKRTACGCCTSTTNCRNGRIVGGACSLW